MGADRDLFLHEYIDINGMHQWDYMEHTLQQSGDEKVEFELLGTWYTMGITARWPQVVNVWEIPGGWDGWFGKIDRLGLKRATNVTLNSWWKQAYEYRSGGFDRLLGAVPGLPEHRVARARRGAGRAVRARDDRGAAGHRARVPRRGARGTRAAPRGVRPPPRRALRGDDERLRGVHHLGHQPGRPRAGGQGARRGPRASRTGAAWTPTRGSRRGTPGRASGRCTGARSS